MWGKMSVKSVKDVKVYSCEPGHIRRCWYKVFPYDAVAEELRRGREVLVEGISRQLAHYACQKLSKMLGVKVRYARGELDTLSLRVSGYAFFVEEDSDSAK